MDKDPYGESYFEGRGSNYWWTAGGYGNLSRFPHWRQILGLIRRIKGRGRLLDIGCAYGLLINKTSRHFDSFGVDISSFAAMKSKKYCRGKVLRASATNLPFQDKSFDVITAIDTLEHVPYLNLDQCMIDIDRTLKPNGVLFLQLPNPLIWAHFCRHFGLEDKTHANDFSLEVWKAILKKRGFSVEQCFGFIAFALGMIRFFAKSERALSLFPEWWVIVRKTK